MIRVGFSHANGIWSFLSKIIMWVTKRPYSHCWFLLEGEDAIRGVPMVLEATEKGGLHLVPWVGYEVGKTIVLIKTPPFPLTEGVNFLMNQLGSGYDIGGLIGQSWVIAMKRWFKIKAKNPLRSARAMWCSEAVIVGIQHSTGYDNAKNLDPERSTPGDVADVLDLQQVD